MIQSSISELTMDCFASLAMHCSPAPGMSLAILDFRLGSETSLPAAAPDEDQPGFERYADPPRPDQVVRETYCRTRWKTETPEMNGNVS